MTAQSDENAIPSPARKNPLVAFQPTPEVRRLLSKALGNPKTSKQKKACRGRQTKIINAALLRELVMGA